MLTVKHMKIIYRFFNYHCFSVSDNLGRNIISGDTFLKKTNFGSEEFGEKSLKAIKDDFR